MNNITVPVVLTPHEFLEKNYSTDSKPDSSIVESNTMAEEAAAVQKLYFGLIRHYWSWPAVYAFP